MTPTQALETLRHATLHSPPSGDAAEALEVLALLERDLADLKESEAYAHSVLDEAERAALDALGHPPDCLKLKRIITEIGDERDAETKRADAAEDSYTALSVAMQARIAELERDLAACMEAKSALAGELELLSSDENSGLAVVARAKPIIEALEKRVADAEGVAQVAESDAQQMARKMEATESELAAVGQQLHAAREEIERMRPVVEAATEHVEHCGMVTCKRVDGQLVGLNLGKVVREFHNHPGLKP